MNVLNFDDLKVTTNFNIKTNKKKNTMDTIAEKRAVES